MEHKYIACLNENSLKRIQENPSDLDWIGFGKEYAELSHKPQQRSDLLKNILVALEKCENIDLSIMTIRMTSSDIQMICEFIATRNKVTSFTVDLGNLSSPGDFAATGIPTMLLRNTSLNRIGLMNGTIGSYNFDEEADGNYKSLADGFRVHPSLTTIVLDTIFPIPSEKSSIQMIEACSHNLSIGKLDLPSNYMTKPGPSLLSALKNLKDKNPQCKVTI